MLRYRFVPRRRAGEALEIILSDPTDLPLIDELVLLFGRPVTVTVGTPSAIESILTRSESSQRVLDEATESFQAPARGTLSDLRAAQTAADLRGAVEGSGLAVVQGDGSLANLLQAVVLEPHLVIETVRRATLATRQLHREMA